MGKDGCCGSSCGCHDNDPREELVRLFKIKDSLQVLIGLGYDEYRNKESLTYIEGEITKITEDIV